MTYKASLSRSQGRAGWSVQFRHPALVDPRSGRNGRRIRAGLGTRDEALAATYVAELNTLLGDERWWTFDAKMAAEGKFDERVIDIFYSGLDSAGDDPRAIREQELPLPARSEGWKRVLLLGTTGAGKTTLVRQLIGTDPDEERFPTTATGRTTIADTEIILRAGNFKAVVTFFQLDEIREYVLDCLLRASILSYRDESRAEVQRAVLQHPDQRFRFNYILGDGSSTDAADIAVDDLLGDNDFALPKLSNAMPELGQLDGDETQRKIDEVVDRVIALSVEHGARIRKELDPNGSEDARVLDELLEQGLDEVLRDDEEIYALVDDLVDQMAARFDLVSEGHLPRNRQGWAQSWSYETEDRRSFIRQLRRFTSNSKMGFGRLLTPLVSGVRVSGPFKPSWYTGDDYPPLVLFDTEGLGHTPDSSSSLPTRLTRLIDESDAVVLVDNSAQPMQAAPAAALRALARSGQAAKLRLCFTHFDSVTGDNLPSDHDRARHVLQSCSGVLARIGEEFGPFAERPLRHRVKSGSYFLADAQKSFGPSEDLPAILQLRKLMEDLRSSGGRPTLAETRPVYDKANLVVAIRDAAEDFNEHWKAVLGLTGSSDIAKAHWGKVKALSRRIAFRMDDEYLHLRPVAHLQAELQGELVKLVQNPLQWSAGEPTHEERQAVLEELVARLNSGLLDLCKRRMTDDQIREWQHAYGLSGRGSTFDRARLISNHIYEQAAPVPRATPNANASTFLREVIEVVAEGAKALDIKLQ
jgi:hypothetical protein